MLDVKRGGWVISDLLFYRGGRSRILPKDILKQCILIPHFEATGRRIIDGSCIVGIARHTQIERRRLRDLSDTEIRVSALPLQAGEHTLSYYELRFIADGEVIWTMQEVFPDDLDALDEARIVAVAHDVQVWQGVKLIAHVKIGDKPLNVGDPVRQLMDRRKRP